MLSEIPTYAKIEKWNRGKLASAINAAKHDWGNKPTQKTIIEWLYNGDPSTILDLHCRKLWDEYVEEHTKENRWQFNK